MDIFTFPGGYTVPANISIIVLIEPMNLDPELYPEPLTFNPDRFDRKPSHPYSYIPFGAGPRNCIGMYPNQRIQKVEGDIYIYILN